MYERLDFLFLLKTFSAKNAPFQSAISSLHFWVCLFMMNTTFFLSYWRDFFSVLDFIHNLEKHNNSILYKVFSKFLIIFHYAIVPDDSQQNEDRSMA